MTADISEEKTQQLVAGCVTVIIGGGGESVAALEVFGKRPMPSHVCPGGCNGGVSLELLARASLPTTTSQNNHYFNVYTESR